MRLEIKTHFMEKAVVDANVFIHGRGSYPFNKAVTSQDVVDELQSDHGKNMLRTVNYTVKAPSENSVKLVREKSKELNSPTSDADEKLLALARDSDLMLLTDDIALQNLALHLDLDFQGFLEDEVDNKFKWIKICKNCGSKVTKEKCSSCGSTRLRRKQVRCS